ncbi:hypothetical protein QYF36_002155 [Acer negundo]|nr:hypothetical protein QYF36_002155 [Acer negundo]
MSWFGSAENEEWLFRSAIGVLKEFASVEAVNKKLEDMGFVFSYSYMGRKWTMVRNVKGIKATKRFHPQLEIRPPICNGAVKIAKDVRLVSKADKDTSSSDDDFRGWANMYFNKFKGECSRVGNELSEYHKIGPQEIGLNGNEKSIYNKFRMDAGAKDLVETYSNKGSPIEMGSQRESQSSSEEGEDISPIHHQEAMSNNLCNGQKVIHKFVETDQGLDLFVDLRSQGEETRNREKERSAFRSADEGRRKGLKGYQTTAAAWSLGRNVATKIHPMNTRGTKARSSQHCGEGNDMIAIRKRVIWNLEEEIAKVIEKRAAL